MTQRVCTHPDTHTEIGYAWYTDEKGQRWEQQTTYHICNLCGAVVAAVMGEWYRV